MRRWIVGAAGIAVVVLAGCSGSGSPDAGAKASASPVSVKVWQSKVSAAMNAGSGDACTDVTTDGCASYVRHLMATVDGLRDASGSGKPPKALSLIKAMDAADADFVDRSCTNVPGSPCFQDVTTIVSDASDLNNALVGG